MNYSDIGGVFLVHYFPPPIDKLDIFFNWQKKGQLKYQIDLKQFFKDAEDAKHGLYFAMKNKSLLYQHLHLHSSLAERERRSPVQDPNKFHLNAEGLSGEPEGDRGGSVAR